MKLEDHHKLPDEVVQFLVEVAVLLENSLLPASRVSAGTLELHIFVLDDSVLQGPFSHVDDDAHLVLGRATLRIKPTCQARILASNKVDRFTLHATHFQLSNQQNNQRNNQRGSNKKLRGQYVMEKEQRAITTPTETKSLDMLPP